MIGKVVIGVTRFAMKLFILLHISCTHFFLLYLRITLYLICFVLVLIIVFVSNLLYNYTHGLAGNQLLADIDSRLFNRD